MNQALLGDLVHLHYGHSLKAEDRIANGKHVVFGANGPVGRYSQRLFDYPSILIGRKGSVGEITYAPNGGWAIDTTYYLEVKDANVIDLRYLYYALRKTNLKRFTITTSIPGINRDTLSKVKIPVIPLPEQKTIVAVLDKTEAALAKRRQTLALTDDLLKSAFLDLFGDPQVNPKGWPLVELQTCYPKIGEGTKCGPFGSALKKEEYTDTGIPVWRLENIHNSRFDQSDCLYISADKFEGLKSYAVENGDILISRAGTVGKMCVVEYDKGPSIISTNLIRLRLDKHKLLPGHFVALMTYCKGRVGRLKTGSDGAYTHMNTGILNQLPIPLPPLHEQNCFAEIAMRIDMTKERQRVGERELEILFAALLVRFFSGNGDNEDK